MESDEPAVRFKAKKRSKTLRRRGSGGHDEHETAVPAAAHDTPPTRDDGDDDDDGRGNDDDAVQAALKLRQARTRHRFRGGVSFGRDEPSSSSAAAPDTDMVLLRDAAQGLPDRFMHQTGFVADADDRHMMAYIESRLSSRGGGRPSAEPTAPAPAERSEQQQQQHKQQARAPGTVQTGTSTTSWPKLVEVEVPAAATQKGKKHALDGEAKPPPPPPRRRRHRRGSDDVKRDAMVEAFLSENKLDVYDVSTTTPSASADPTRSADDVLADNFRQQYMDEVAARRQRRRPAINQPRVSQRQAAHQQAVAAGEVLKGPKLGGSRNARAAVRDALLQQQEMAKKSR